MKSELRKQQYTVTLFDCNHLAHVIVSWQIQKFICYCTVIVSQYFAFEGNFQIQTPGGLYSDARFNRVFFCAPSLGSYIWGGAYSRNFTVYPVDSIIQHFNNWGQVATICFGTVSEAVSAASITAVYSNGNCSCVHKLVLHLYLLY